MPAKMSVRLSIARRYCVKKTKHILKLFAPSGSQTILFFSTPYVVAIFRQGLLTGYAWYEMQGMKNRDFRPISSFTSAMIQDRAIVTIQR